MLNDAQITEIRKRADAHTAVPAGPPTSEGILISVPGETTAANPYRAQAADDVNVLLADRDELVRRLSEAEAELAGLREIATSGPSTASGPSLLSHPVTWCAAWDNERAAICGRNRPCSVHGAAAPMEDAP